MNSNFDNALFSLTGSVEAVRETMASINFGKPNVYVKPETLRKVALMGQEPNDAITFIKNNTDDYMKNLNATNALVSKLLKDLENKQSELDSERKYVKELNAKLDLYRQTTIANVNRNTFNYYLHSIKGRPAKDDEWTMFQGTFKYDNSELDKQIYNWISVNL